MVNKDTVICFRYKKEDIMVSCDVYPEKLWDDWDGIDNCIYVDIDDDSLERLIDALKSMLTYGEQLKD